MTDSHTLHQAWYDKLSPWEVVTLDEADRFPSLIRLKVPGGWLYGYYNISAAGLTFVPTPNSHHFHAMGDDWPDCERCVQYVNEDHEIQKQIEQLHNRIAEDGEEIIRLEAVIEDQYARIRELESE